MNINLGSLGTVIAIAVLVLAIVFIAIGQLPPIVGGLIALLALARIT